MEQGRQPYGSAPGELAEIALIAPVDASVIDANGQPVGEVAIEAPVSEVMTRSGAERAAKATVREEIGPGLVKVAGGLIAEITAAGQAYFDAIDAEVAEATAQVFEDDLEANGLGEGHLGAEADQAEPTLFVDAVPGSESETPRIIIEDEVANSSELVAELSHPLGGLALLDTVTGVEIDDGYADVNSEEVLASETYSPNLLGEPILFSTIEVADISEETDNEIVDGPQDELDETSEEAVPVMTNEALGDPSDETVVSMIGSLMVSSTTEIGLETEELLFEAIALNAMTVLSKPPKPKTEYVQAA